MPHSRHNIAKGTYDHYSVRMTERRIRDCRWRVVTSIRPRRLLATAGTRRTVQKRPEHAEEAGSTLTSHVDGFKKALERIEPGDDASNAQEAHKQVAGVLEADDKLKRLGVRPLLIGSYRRNVSIRRVKDVDMFGRLDNATETTWPGEIYNHVVDLLEDAFPGNVERQHRSVKIDFPEYDLSVDVVIARPCVNHPDEHWQIPQRLDENCNARWIETNPAEMTRLTIEANAEFVLNGRGAYVPTVKLVRQVRRTWVGDQPGGYYFEVLAWHAFQDLKPEQTSFAGYLTVVLEWIAAHLEDFVTTGPADPTMEGKTIKSKATADDITAAAARMAQAAVLARAALDEEDACASAEMWQRLLGQHQTDPGDPFSVVGDPLQLRHDVDGGDDRA